MAEGGAQAFDAPAGTTTVSVGDGAITDSSRQVVMAKNTLFRRCFKRKPLEVVHAEEEEGVLERTLGFWDLFALGFGGTVGSGVFVMTGLICHEIAGPAGIVSWFVAGFGCLLSGLSFAELSWRVPSAGGAYAYSFVALGEMPAAIVGWCMTLEYGLSAAAVAKSWGEMLSVGLAHASEDESSEGGHGSDGITILGVPIDIGGVFAALLQGVCVLIVVGGLKASTITVNTFCVAKGLLVVFMTITAFSLYEAENLVPFAPHGASGVLKGSVAAFFGFLGFDEVVLLSPEAKNPAKHVPRALFASLVAVTIVCAAASMSLSGAAAATDLDSDSAFAEAFRDRGMKAAYKITAIGELVTLPLVVLVSFMAQPRLLFAMAKDGLLPHLFAEVDSRGTLLKGSLVSGGVCMLTALLVPFDALDNIISAGVLLAFNLVTSSLLVLRHRACRPQPVSVNASFHEDDKETQDELEETEAGEGIAIVLYANFAACLSAGLSILAGHAEGVGSAVLATVAVAGGAAMLYVLAGLQSSTSHARDLSGGNFLAPFFPWPQALALWVNWFLVCQLPLHGLLALVAYVTFAAVHYVCYGSSRSVGNCTGWSLLLSSTEGGRPAGGSRCRLLSADDVENATIGETPTDCLSPSVIAPLLPDGGEGEPAEQQQPLQRAGGGGDSPPPPPPPPPMTVVGTVRSTPGATPQHQRVRRRSLDGIR